MSGNQKFPSDLLLVAGLVILTDIFVLVPVLSESLIRTALGLPLLLFLPGYALIAMLFPEKSGLEGMERIALSIAMSVSVVPLIGLALGQTSWGIHEIPLLTSFSGFTLTMLVIAYIRRSRLPADKAFEVSFRTLAFNLISGAEPRSKTEKSLRIILALFFLILIGTGAYVVLVPQEKNPYTEFYILGTNGMANNYTTQYIQGESGNYTIGIANHEYKTMNYTMEVRLENKSLPLPENLQHIKLDHNTTLEEPLKITPPFEGNNMKLEFLLFNETEKNVPYKDLHLWINVKKEV
jgi:Predicted membrane protein